MTTVYGCSDDLIEVDGDVRGEVGHYSSRERKPCILSFSDGTMLAVWYGKRQGGIWNVRLLHAGALFVRIDECTDADANPYSDVAHFHDGLKWVKYSNRWATVD